MYRTGSQVWGKMLRWLVTSRMPLRPQAFWFWRPEAEGLFVFFPLRARTTHHYTGLRYRTNLQLLSVLSLTVCALGKDAYYTC
jgi:hypothetical protein